MKIRVARFIDYWIGLPICFMLFIFESFRKTIFADKSNPDKPKRILFLEFSEMGSAILAYSSMSRVKETYPESELYFWIFRRNQDSVHLLNIMPQENVFTVRDSNLSPLLLDTFLTLWQIRRKKIDTVIDMELFSRFSSILSYLSGAGIRVGFHKFSMEGLFRGNLHTHRVIYNPYMHISKNFLSLTFALNEILPTVPVPKISFTCMITIVPLLRSSEEKKVKVWQEIKELNPRIDTYKNIIILNPGINEALPLRAWPIENYTELSKRLLADEKNFIILIGAKTQDSYGKIINDKIKNDRIIDLIGKTSVRELIDLYNISTLLISHDSGATNLASLTEIPLIVMFGPETPLLYSPLARRKIVLYASFACSPCLTAYNHRRSLCKKNKCMQAITVEQVYNSAKEILYKQQEANII